MFLFFFVLLPTLKSTLFPYTTLFRSGSKVSGAIAVASVPGGSGNYIQNATTQQASSNFNISGNGNAGGTLSGNIVDRKSTRLNSSHVEISYAVFCLKKKKY